MLVETDDGSVWLNEVPDVTVGNGIYIGANTAQAVEAMEEVIDILQGPPGWGEGGR